MSTHKTVKAKNFVSQYGLLHTGTGHSGSSDFGFVGEYINAGTKYTGFVRHTDGQFYLFDGLTVNPFNPLTNDTVNVAGAGFTNADLNLGNVIATGDVSTVNGDIYTTNGDMYTTNGSVSAGNITIDTNQIISTNTNGNIDILPNGTGSINLGGASNQVLILATPTSDYSAVTKQYVDGLSQGYTSKGACRARTTDDLADTPGIIVAGSGPTKTLTSVSNGLISGDAASFDGVSLALNDRVLIMDQGTGTGSAVDNGLYYVSDVGSAGTPWVLTRTLDANQSADWQNGVFTFVSEGTLWAATGWLMTTYQPITLETTPINFVQFSQMGTINGINLDVSGSALNVFRDKTGSDLNFRAILLSNNASANTSAIAEASVTSTDILINIDQSKITGTGALASGSIASGFGSIVTTNAITTTNTITGATVQTTGGNLSMTGGTLAFAAGTGNNVISIADNVADALSIKDGGVNFFKVVTTTGAQSINVGKPLSLMNGTLNFSAASGSNIVNLINNAADALTFKDPTSALGYVQFVTTTGSESVNILQPAVFNAPATFNYPVTFTAGMTSNVTTIVGDTTLDNTYDIVLANAASNTVTVTLPDATANYGRQYKIIKTDASANLVTVEVATGDYLDGVQNDTLLLPAKMDHTYIISTGAPGWIIV